MKINLVLFKTTVSDQKIIHFAPFFLTRCVHVTHCVHSDYLSLFCLLGDSRDPRGEIRNRRTRIRGDPRVSMGVNMYPSDSVSVQCIIRLLIWR